MKLLRDIRNEYAKVYWPKKDEIISSTMWIVFMTLFVVIYLGIFDFLAKNALDNLKALVTKF